MKVLLFLCIPLLFAAGCNQPANNIPKSTSRPANSPDDTSTWQVYTNSEYGYRLKYPKDWRVQEFSSLKEQLIQERPYRYIEFYSPADASGSGYVLHFGLKRKNETNLALSTRTGTGVGDFVKGDSIKIGGKEILTSYLVFEGIASDIFYTDHGLGEFQLGNFVILAEFSGRDYNAEKFFRGIKKLTPEQKREALRKRMQERKYASTSIKKPLDIRKVPEAVIANKILSSLAFTKTAAPTSKGVLDNLAVGVQGWAYDNGKDYKAELTFQSVENPDYSITVSSNSSIYDEYRRRERLDSLDGSFLWVQRPDVGENAKGFQFSLSAYRENKPPQYRKHNVDVSKGGHDYKLIRASYNGKPFPLPTVLPVYTAYR